MSAMRWLEKVAARYMGANFDQSHRIARFEVVSEDERHRASGISLANGCCRHQRLIGERRRHLYVYDGHIRCRIVDLRQQLPAVGGLCDDIDPGFDEHPHNPLAGEQRVIGYDDAHGSITSIPPSRVSTRPPSASMRSRRVEDAPAREFAVSTVTEWGAR